MAYREILTQNISFTLERMGSSLIGIPTVTAGGSIDLTGSTMHLWVGAPLPFKPITLGYSQVNPLSGYTFTPTQVQFKITEADLSAWGLPPGNWPYELLTSNDGGVTTDKVGKGNLTVGSWVTDTF